MSAALLFLDSADLTEARRADASRVVGGITTNPSIIGLPRGAQPKRLLDLLDTFEIGPVFYQLTAPEPTEAQAEIRAVNELTAAHRDRVVFKLPAQEWLYPVGAQLVADGREVAFTAVYSAGQALAASAAGASWLIPYVDRAARLAAAAGPLVPRLAAVTPPGVRILAASIKSADQAVQAIVDGASGVTTSWQVIADLIGHPLTDSAVDEFHTALDLLT
jgi:transaldolase